jgi:hypothetical protein
LEANLNETCPLELAGWARFDKRILDAFADSSLTNLPLPHKSIEVVQRAVFDPMETNYPLSSNTFIYSRIVGHDGQG